jgi:hypothetical protein
MDKYVFDETFEQSILKELTIKIHKYEFLFYIETNKFNDPYPDPLTIPYINKFIKRNKKIMKLLMKLKWYVKHLQMNPIMNEIREKCFEEESFEEKEFDEILKIRWQKFMVLKKLNKLK